MTIRQQVAQTNWQVGLVAAAPVFGLVSWLFVGLAHDVLQALMCLSFSLAAMSLLAHWCAAHTPTCDTCGDACRDEDNGLCDRCVSRVSEVA